MQTLGNWWCRMFHGRPMHPVHGVYRCRKCLRTFPTGWDGPMKPQALGPNGQIGDQMKKKTQEVRLSDRRHAARAEKSQMFRYPFGLLNIIDRFANVRPAKKAAKPKDVAA